MDKCKHCSNRVRKAGAACGDCKTRERQAEAFKPTVQAFIDAFPVPSGFTKSTGEGFHNGTVHEPNGSWGMKDQPWWRQSLYVLIESVEQGVKVAVSINRGPEMHSAWSKDKKPKRLPARPVLSASGHTCFKNEQGHWLTFDRRGVSDSFYLGPYSGEDGGIEGVIRGQLDQVAKSRETSKHMVSIPGFGFRIHESELQKTRELIQGGGTRTFTPGGFGTGHRLSIRPGRYSKQMPAETAAFFGVPALYDDQFDHD